MTMEETGCFNPSCSANKSSIASLSRCGRCQWAKYCSGDCQKMHWKLHKTSCIKRNIVLVADFCIPEEEEEKEDVKPLAQLIDQNRFDKCKDNDTILLKNKYYHALVQIIHIPNDMFTTFEAADEEARKMYFENSLFKTMHGIVVLFDSDSEESYHQATTWLHELLASDHVRTPAIRLLLSQEPPIPEGMEMIDNGIGKQAVVWSSDHSVELIRVPFGDELKEESKKKSILQQTSGDIVGMNRVLDALHANFWDFLDQTKKAFVEPVEKKRIENRVNEVLLVSGSQSGKKFILERLRTHLASTNGTIEEDVTTNTWNWQLRTKYYVAQMQIKIVSITTIERDTLKSPNTQGLIILYDATCENGFQHVHSWGAFAKKHDLPVMLCIGNEVSKPMEHEDHDSAYDFSLDHGMEFLRIEHNETDEKKEEEEGDSSGFKSGLFAEKFGTARLLEALESNMWQHHVLHSDSKANETQNKMKDFASALSRGDDDDNDEPKVSKFDDAETVSSIGEDNLEDHQLGLDSAAFSQLMEKMMNVREQAKGLSDEQRRQRAADILQEMLKMEGFEDI